MFGAKPAAAPAINVTTPATNSSSTFGFGSTTQNQNQQSGTTAPPGSSSGGGGLFGGFGQQNQQNQQGQQQPAAGGSLFGGLGQSGQQQQQQQPAAGTSLFGGLGQNNQPQQAQQQQQQQSTGGLFGGLGQSQTQNQPAGSSLFGAGGTSSLFGAKPATPAAGQSTTGGGLFGGGGFGQGSTTQQPAGGGSSLFGGGASTNQPAQGTSSLFGQTQQQGQQNQQGQGSTLFGTQSTSAQPSNSLFGNQQQAVAQPANQQITGSTRFQDVPANVQTFLGNMQSHMETKRKEGKRLRERTQLTGALYQVSADIRAAQSECSALDHTFQNLAKTIIIHDQRVKEAEKDLKVVADVVSNQRGDNKGGRVNYHNFSQEIFVKAAKEMHERVTKYKETIAQLQNALESLASSTERPSPQVISQTIQNHQRYIETLAAQVERTNNKLEAMKANFRDDYQKKLNTAVDPFELARQQRAGQRVF